MLTNNGGTLGTCFVCGVTLDGSTPGGAVTINGSYTSTASNTLTGVDGSINSHGNFQVAGSPGAAFGLIIQGNVTLQGGGAVTLSNNAFILVPGLGNTGSL
jgi:hypothetical protein